MTATRWLIDTNVVSELGKRRPDSRVVSFMSTADMQSLHISCVSMAELRFGILRSTDAESGARLSAWLDSVIRPMFSGRVLDVTEAVMLRWVTLVDAGRRERHTFSQPDLIIAAQALELGLTLVTRNTSDFERTGVPVLNPWSD